MFTFNGIGTRLYGKRHYNGVDGSYIATKWFVIMFLPIVPLGSYKVWRGNRTDSWLPMTVGVKTTYPMVPVKLNVEQVIKTYLVAYGIVGLFLILFMLIQ